MYKPSSPSNTASWAVPEEELLHNQQVSSVATGSKEKKIFVEPLGGQHEKISGGFLVQSYEMGCVYLDVDVSD